jgi:hypothetical protein
MPRMFFTDRNARLLDELPGRSLSPARNGTPAKATHTHIWLHDPPHSRDAAAGAPAEPGPTQGPDSELGEHLCSIRQHGETGEWLGEDAEGNPVIVRGGPELRVFRSRARGAVARQG